jgi:hypothetical protein
MKNQFLSEQKGFFFASSSSHSPPFFIIKVPSFSMPVREHAVIKRRKGKLIHPFSFDGSFFTSG